MAICHSFLLKLSAASILATLHIVQNLKAYGLDEVQKIQAANKLAGTHLDIGQVLVIPAQGVPDAPAAPKVYQVKKGDTPFMIANRYKMPLERLLRINRLTPRCTIYPGQRLHIE